ncbi:GH92 family glycosyl hydrolase [Kitasatospora sp. NBC_01287]|uniref:GH92 family glycosyl hydrolase n=1 Tax=Kitasatospora sp. NBC_01287 TaxID=2903573 RepID=UPI00224F8C61|nr:GH92 family glycosyl hydrolase [Kitasatospora sp. NBC_01287]MCX4750842.1 GH92 family glycosyl hydrolase [Kitasatospora sp. NBC_01287]
MLRLSAATARRPRALLLAGALLAALTLAPAARAGAEAPADRVTDPAALVDTFAGTGNGGGVVGQVDTFPGADAPFGMLQWSPDTPSRPPGGGYDDADQAITGYSLTHLSGPGCSIAGDIPFLPLTGALPADPGAAGAPFDHASEQAGPGSYAVTAGGVRTRLAVSTRAGVGSFSYPATDRALLLVKVADSANGSSAAAFQTVGDREITGTVTSGHFCGQPDSYTVHFAARFDRPFSSVGTWGGQDAASAVPRPGSGSVSVSGPDAQPPASAQPPLSAQPGGTAQAAQGGPAARQRTAPDGAVVAGGWLTFDTRTDPVVGMQVALSYVSVRGAEANLAAEARSWDVDAVARQTHDAWNRALGAVAIGGGTRQQQATFYTALYHSLLHPNTFSDADGSYLGFDNAVHHVPKGHAQYADYSGWDIYRSQIPLLALIAPDRMGDMATSLLDDADQMGGWLPKWPVANGESGVMNGDPADPILADAYAFGARDFDAGKALAAMVNGAEATGGPPGQGWYVERPNAAAYLSRGYVPNLGSDSISPVPNGASETLEYALDDFAVSRLAGALGQRDTAARFAGRSQNWAQLFDTATGYLRPRDAQGAFPSGPPVQTTGGFGQSGFQEGNAAQYTWMVPQNLAALMAGMGGPAAAAGRLDAYFSQLNAGPDLPYHWQGNEPAFDTPWAYDTAGQPWKTQATVRAVMDQLYRLGPGGEPGNDDLGAMSSWYVWAALGLYPQTPGVPMLVLGSPLFPHAVLHTGHGDLTINALGAGGTYVQSLAVDGRPSSRTWIDPTRAHRLDFTLGTNPDPAWGSGAGDAPPSFGAGPVHFPPTTRAAVSADPAQLRIAPGAGSGFGITVDNSAGAVPATVSWSLTDVPAALTASPAAGTATVAPGATARTPVTLTAAADAATGYYQVGVDAHEADGAVIAHTSLLVTVARPGETIPTAYVSNYSDNTVTPVDTRTRTAGPPIPVGSGPDGMVVAAGHLFVADNNSDDVTVIDTTSNAVTATVKVGGVAAGLAATPDGKTVWVSDFGDGTVQPIDTATLAAGPPVRVGSQPERVAVSPDGAHLWVADQGDGTVSVVDLASRAVTATIPVGTAPFGVALTPDGSRAYVSDNGSGAVSVLDARGYRLLGTVPVGAAPEGLALTPDGGTLYVTDAGSGGVTPIAVATGTPGPLLATGAGAYAVAFGPDGSTAWVVDSNVNDVRPVTVATGQVGPPIATGNVPDGIAVTG